MSQPSLAGAEAARAVAAKLKKRWRKENAADAAAALAAHPELAEHTSVVVDLAYEEYLLREQAGDAPSPASFAARFPPFRSYVHSVIAAHRQLIENPELLAGGDDDWPQPGEKVGRVELMAVLGGGGFGRAYLAYDPVIHRPCVLKLTTGSTAEAQVIGQLHHPHVTGVYWAEEVGGRTAVCMPLVGANTLAEVIGAAFPAGGPTADRADVILAVAAADDPGEGTPAVEAVVRAGESYALGAAAVAARVAGAVAYIHQQGVAHGDLKPSNVVIGRGGSPLLIDFNLSTRTADPAAVRGTPGYLAPELLEAADPLASTADLKRADLFALGVLVTELLTGRRPFPDADPKSFAAQAAAARTPPAFPATVPPAVAEVLAACLSPDPAARPVSAAVLAARLDGVVMRARASRFWRRAAAATATVALAAAVGLSLMPPPNQVVVEKTYTIPTTTPEGCVAHGYREMAVPNWARAQDYFLKADQLRPNPWAVAMAAYCATTRGKHDEAVGFAQAVDRRLRPTGGAPADVLNNLGYSLLQLSRPADALPVFDRALARQPGMPAASYNRAVARFRDVLTGGDIHPGAVGDIRVALAAAAGRPSAELHYHATLVFAAASDKNPGLRPEVYAHVRAAIAAGRPAAGFRTEPAFRTRFRTGFGSNLAFEAACATPQGPVTATPRVQTVEPQPF